MPTRDIVSPSVTLSFGPIGIHTNVREENACIRYDMSYKSELEGMLSHEQFGNDSSECARFHPKSGPRYLLRRKF